jgi:hypothetical protein
MSTIVFPNGGRSVIEQMCQMFPELHVNNDEKQRELTSRIQQQFAYQWGGRWGGKKRAGPSEMSKDSMAYDEGGATSTWDMFQGNTAATILPQDGQPPNFVDMPPSEAEFIPVTARDWLGAEVGPGPGPTPDDDDEILDTLHDMQSQMVTDTAQIMALDNYNTDRVLEKIDDVKTQMEEGLKKVLAIYLAMNRPGNGEPDEPDIVPPGEGDGGLSEMQKALLKWMLQNRPTGGRKR